MRRSNILPVDYADPEAQTAPMPESKEKPLAKFFASAKYPLEQRIQDKKRGIGRQKHPFVGEFQRLLAICYFHVLE